LPCSDRLAAELAAELAHVLAGLRAYDGAGLLPRFEAALDDAIAASAALARLSHRVALGREPPPAAGDYLDLAARDVNYRSVALALLLLTADGDGGVDRLDPALATACRTVRLANDLATAAKDRRDGRLNVLGLRWRGGSPVTADDVDREIDRCMQVHAGLLRGTTGAVWTRALVNSLRMAVGLFRLAAG
jgi:hypothetical protein